MGSRVHLKSPFIYPRLSHPDKVRIFYLYPGGNDDIIVGSLTEIDITKAALTYSAISYVWGDPTKTSMILCNGQTLSIPATLDVILRRLRRTSEQTTALSLWADSICINQDTKPEALSERSHQVGRMGLIFSCADMVYVDLGDIHSDTYHHLNDLHEAMRNVSWTDEYPNTLRVQCKDVNNIPQASHAGWHSLAKLMSHPWFTRMWVIQEFTLAKNVVLLIGTDIESDAHFLEQATKCGCFFLYNDDLNRNPAHSQIRYTILLRYINIALLHKQRAMTQSTLGVTWQQFNSVLLLRENFAATDCRDFVYALLGLVPSNSNHLLAANYDEHPHELGRRLYLHFLSHGHGVYGLYHSVGTTSTSVSWSISLHPKPRDHLFNVLSDGTSHRSNACGNTKPHIIYSDNPPALIAKAYIIDTISLIFPKSIPSRPPNSDNTLISAIWMHELLNWLGLHNLSPLDHHNNAQNLSRTLCCGRFDSKSDIDSAIPNTILPFLSKMKLPSHINESSSPSSNLKESPFLTSSLSPSSQVQYNRILTVLDLIPFRKFAVSNSGRLCFVPEQTQIGDQVVIVSGAPVPFVLRPVLVATAEGVAGGDGGGGRGGKEGERRDSKIYFHIVGACYVDGIMDGEIFTSGDGEAEGRKVEEINVEIR